jgi:hypothetical protein
VIPVLAVPILTIGHHYYPHYHHKIALQFHQHELLQFFLLEDFHFDFELRELRHHCLLLPVLLIGPGQRY